MTFSIDPNDPHTFYELYSLTEREPLLDSETQTLFRDSFKHWALHSQGLGGKNATVCRKLVYDMAQGIFQALNELKIAGSPAKELQIKAGEMLNELDNMAKTRFCSQKAANALDVKKESFNIERYIHEMRLSPVKDPKMRENSSHWDKISDIFKEVEAHRIKEERLDFHLADKILGLPGEAIGWGADQVCGIHPVMENACSSLGEVVLTGVQWAANSLPEPVYDFLARREEGFEFETEIEEKEYGIPKEDSLNYKHALGGFAVGAVLGLTPAGKAAGKALAKKVGTAGYRLQRRLPEVPADVNALSNLQPFRQNSPSSIRFQAYSLRQLQLEKQKSLIDAGVLRLSNESFRKPRGFPNGIVHFFDECFAYPFKLQKLGVDKIGGLEGLLLYKQLIDENMKKKGLFLIQDSMSSMHIQKRFGPRKSMIESHHINFQERLNHWIEAIKDVAREKNFESVYLAFDPDVYPVLNLFQHSVDGNGPLKGILSSTTLSRGADKASIVIEIAVPK